MEAKVSEVVIVYSYAHTINQAVESFDIDANKYIKNGYQPVGDYKWAIVHDTHYITQQFVKR